MKRLISLFIICLPVIGYAQSVQFTKDSIPRVGKVIFNVNFEYDLSQEEFHKRAYSYLNDRLDPYLGVFNEDNRNRTITRITDYLEIDASIFQVFGMYMAYTLEMEYQDGACFMTIRNIMFMEKKYFESKKASQRKLNMPEYTGEEIMIDKKYALMLKPKASERITDQSLIRINEIIRNLDVSFTKK